MARPAKPLDPSTMTPFGRRLYELMTHRGENQTQLAEAIRVAPATVNRALRGKRSVASDSTTIVLRAAQFIGLSPDFWSRQGPVESFTSATGASESANKEQSMFAAALEDPRAVFIHASAHNQDPPEVVRDLALLTPPDGGGSLAWWLDQYLTLVRKYPRKP